MTRLRVFEASGCGLNASHFRSITDDISGGVLESIVLNNSTLGVEISLVANLKTLRSLYLQSCSIDFEILNPLGKRN